MSIASTTPSDFSGLGSRSAMWAEEGFSARDLEQLQALGKDPAEALRELSILRKGSRPLSLLRPCTPGDGVKRFTEGERLAAAKRFRAEGWQRQICKFVAAAGSASRMFRMFDENDGAADETAKRKLGDRLHHMPFFPALDGAMRRRGLDPLRLAYDGNWKPIADSLLGDDGLGLSRLPKGLMPFHSYPDGARTALEEHLVEALGYGVGYGNLLHLHAVVSPRHQTAVAAHLETASKRFRVANVRIKTETSVQADATETIAIDARGEIVRDAAGRMLFRPAGHGAVVGNLNALAADVVFIRTVDNVLPESFHPFVGYHKQVLGGVLLDAEGQIHGCLRELEAGRTAPDAEKLVKGLLSTPLPEDWVSRTAADKRRFLMDRLNRPLRVCAVVPNGGHPGGAPFWVAGDGGARLRIADKPEVNLACPRQAEVWMSNPYFNPADIVCSLRDFHGNAFDLTRFQAADEWYVIDRHYNGEPIRVLERSGLWNGAMAEWNTIFVETPPETLRPVKTILELLEFPELPKS